MGAADDLQEKCAKCEKVVYEAEGLPAGKFIICWGCIYVVRYDYCHWYTTDMLILFCISSIPQK